MRRFDEFQIYDSKTFGVIVKLHIETISLVCVYSFLCALLCDFTFCNFQTRDTPASRNGKRHSGVQAQITDTFLISDGAVAQLGERQNRTLEAGGSIPLCSTSYYVGLGNSDCLAPSCFGRFSPFFHHCLLNPLKFLGKDR